MAYGMTFVRRALAGFGMAIGVPLAVVTCQGTTALEGADAGTITATTGGVESGAGGSSTLDTPPTLPGAGGATPIPQTADGGASTTTGDFVPTDAGAPRVFLGKYPEPVQPQGAFFIPAPPATATVGRPCEARQDVCADGQSRDSWAQNVVSACMAETSSGGCIDFIFDTGISCAKHAVFWHGATEDLGRCVATVSYYESCSGPDNGPNVSVYRYGADCSPL